MTNQSARNEAGIPMRTLGKTGLEVSIIGFGGGHSVRPDIDVQTTVRFIREAIDNGITCMDNAWEYHTRAKPSAGWARRWKGGAIG